MGSSDDRDQVKLFFDAALKINKDERARFLAENVADTSIRDGVEALLAEIDDSADNGHLSDSVGFPPIPCSIPDTDSTFEENRPLQRQFRTNDLLAGRFRVLRFLAAGGMGEIYEAEDLELKGTVALKCIAPNTLRNANAMARFRREVNLARKVTHPNVCRIYDIFRQTTGEEKSKQYIAFVSMELLSGETLAQRIRKKGRFTPEEALPIISQLAGGLEAAHRAGIVHRDFKPGNVMLVPDDKLGRERAVITDFGLALEAKLESHWTVDLTASHGIVGTPAYMAPEQLEGRQATPATDIYALGLVIFEMLTGVRPSATALHISDMLNASFDQGTRVKPPNAESKDIWERAVTRCLQRDPKLRYSSALDVFRDLSCESPDSSSVSQQILHPERSLVVKAVTVLVLLFAVIAVGLQLRSWMTKGGLTKVHASRKAVAVLGFKNLSGKADVAWISPSLSRMLQTELTAGDQLRVIPSERITQGKIDLSLTDEDSLSRETLARVWSNLGSEFVVLGTFLDMGGQLRIDLTLQNAVAGETITNISVTGPEQNLSELATNAGKSLRRTLGIADPLPDDAARNKASQSSSLRATKLYAEGLEKLHSYDSLAARELLQGAIEEDSNFAMAHAALAEAWRSLGYGDKSAAEAKKAMELSGNLSRENSMAIEAQYRNSRHENAQEADIYRSLFTFYPDNLEYGLSLGKSQYSSGQFQEANITLDILQGLPSPQGDDPRIDHLRSIVALDNGDYKKALVLAERVEARAQQRGARRMVAQALLNQCTLQSKLGDPAKATGACEKSRRIFSDIGDIGGETRVWGQIASQAANRGDARGGRIANDRQIALLRKIEDEGGLGWAMNVAGELSVDSGDYTRALDEYNETLKIYQKIGYQSGVISAYGNLGYVNALQGNLKDAVANDEQAIALIRQIKAKGEMDLLLDSLAEVFLDEGDVRDATKQLEEGFEVNSETGDKRIASYLHTARSKLLFAQGKLDESRREAELAIKACLERNDEQGAEERRLLLARLDIAENHHQDAIEALRKALSYFQSKKDEANEIAARAILIEALLGTPSKVSKQELMMLARVLPKTQNANLRLAANLQIARVRFALGDKKSSQELLTDVITESQSMGYESLLLEAKMVRAQIEIQTGHPSEGYTQMEQIAARAEANGLILIANKARSTSRSTPL
jgi:eukaryotic-like serine/threonine-protein kinase